MIMAHSPLKLFKGFHDKRVLVSGQGPVVDIAANLGFSQVTTIDDVRATFPVLDAVDHKRRVSAVRIIQILTSLKLLYRNDVLMQSHFVTPSAVWIGRSVQTH